MEIHFFQSVRETDCSIVNSVEGFTCIQERAVYIVVVCLGK